MPLIDVESILGPEPERPPNTTDPAYKDYPKEKKIAWRTYIRNKQQLKDEAISMGYMPEDLGITGDKDQGQAWKRALEAFGYNDRNYEYNRATGMKRNIATSDMDAQAKGVWVPMTESDKQEYDRHRSDGGNWRNVIARRQADARGQLQNWATNNERRGAGIRRDAAGNLYDVGDDGQNIYYDAYGAQIDPRTGQRSGQIYAGQTMQYGNQLGQTASYGGNFGGVSGGKPAAMGPTNQATQPGYTYMPNANPWGGGSSGVQQSYRPRNTGISGFYGRPSMFGGF